MDRHQQAKRRTGIILGILLLAAVGVLGAKLGTEKINPVPYPMFDTKQVNLFFFLLPFGSLFKKIGARFLSKRTKESERSISAITAFAKALPTAQNIEQATQLMMKAVRAVLNPNTLNLYLYDPEGPGFKINNPKKKIGQPPDFVSLGSSIPNNLRNSTGVLFYKRGESNPQIIEGAKLKECEANLYILAPIKCQSNQLVGWLDIGPHKNDQAYQQSDIDQVELLTSLFSAVLEKFDHTQTYQKQNYENTIRNHIAEALTTSKDLEQVLEKIFHQLNKILAIRDLSLILRNEETQAYERVFSIKDEKIKIKTTNTESLKTDFKGKKAIITGQITVTEENGSCLTIPVLDDEEIIGVLSIGNQDKEGVFNECDFNFIHYLASVVTSAVQIHNLNLVNQRQKQQIDVFNQVSEQLTSIMHLDSLLVNILDAAMTILNCSSGVLMVIDENRDEFVFQATAGPVGSGLQGARFPTHAGFAGQAYTTRQPIISNQVDKTSLWFKDQHPAVVAKIENLMAVPLVAHGQVFGILELINKRNELPFLESDQKILERFANQAAIAVYNASRYSETDKALEARVEELYIMQQIDRHLNETQDIDQALQRMLEAALKHTSACHGTIGLIDQYTDTYENVWQVHPSEDNPKKLDDIDLPEQAWFSSEIFKDQMLHNPKLSSGIELPVTIQWHYLVYSDLEDDQAFLLILHTESSEKLTKGDRAFLSSLKDHGIIALKNALLYQDLNSAIQAKNEFISFISHELKNPLTVIKGYADILRKGMAGEVNEEQIDYLSTINHNVKRMDTFIKDLSDQTRIESKSLNLDFESSSVHEVVNEVLNSYEALIEDKSLKVKLHIPKDIPNVWCDRLRLIQILANLTSNAIKYTPDQGHIMIGVEHSENIWDEKGAAEVVHFWVEDNGYGIAPNDQEHLFEKFYRGSDNRKKQIPGTGLGLRIAKSLVEMMGGKMWFESTLDEGTTFNFTLPI